MDRATRLSPRIFCGAKCVAVNAPPRRSCGSGRWPTSLRMLHNRALMFSHSRRSSIAFLAAFLLLLKAAMPWVASNAALASGVQLVEVCTVYGVQMKPLTGGDQGDAPSGPTSSHVGPDHCSLSSFGAWVPPSVPASPLQPAACTSETLVARSPLCGPHDASARWVAGLKHAPPFLS